MTTSLRDYVLVVQTPAYPLGPDTFATESAFARHLCDLRATLGHRVRHLVLVSPVMTSSEYSIRKQGLGIVKLTEHGVQFLPAFPSESSTADFWVAHFFPMRARLREAIRQACVVHSGLSDDLWRPLMALANWWAWRQHRPVVFVVDIDFRRDSTRFLRLGHWGLRSYLLNRFVYDTLKWIQIWLAVRVCDLVLLKSQSMVDDFGKGRPNVRNFFDSVHSDADVLSDQSATEKAQRVMLRNRPLRLVYFGRLVEYKGLNLSIEGVVKARSLGANVEFSVIGSGDCESTLRRLVLDAQAQDYIHFLSPVPYGDALFQLLTDYDAMLATPLVEDTPRAAFDAFARGLPIVAFDIAYFQDLARLSEAVILSAWSDTSRLGALLCQLAHSKEAVARRVMRAVRFARENTQASWLARRVEWTFSIPGLRSD